MAILDLAMNMSVPLMVTDHHYYPLEVEIANYLANTWSVTALLGLFFGVCGAVIAGTVLIVDQVHPNLPKVEKAAIWWFVICEFPAKLWIWGWRDCVEIGTKTGKRRGK